MRLRKRRCLLLSLVLIGSVTLSINMFKKPKEEKLEEVYIKEVNQKISDNIYYAILEIPDINLKREIFPKDSVLNDVSKNLFITPSSTLPSDKDSNLIIAAHSGDAPNAYFKDLYKLNLNSKVNLYYDNKIFTYKIKEIEYQAKTGLLYLKKNYSNMLTLITCTKDNAKTQTIYYAELENV